MYIKETGMDKGQGLYNKSYTLLFDARESWNVCHEINVSLWLPFIISKNCS